MPINKRKKKPSHYNKPRELLYKDEEQHYAVVNSKFGDGRYEVTLCETEEVKRAKIKGSIRKRSRVEIGSYVVVSKRDFDEKVVDILHLYTKEEAHQLLRYGEIVLKKQDNNEVEVEFDHTIDFEDI